MDRSNDFPHDVLLTGMLFLALAASGAAAEPPADLVLRNGKIVTMDEDHPNAEAVAIRGDRIIAVGSSEDIARHVAESTRVIELNGRLAAPGFIEGHGHFVSLGRSKMVLDLTRVKTWSELVELVAEATETTPPGEWIEGRGWHQAKWLRPPDRHVEGYPVHDELSRRTPHHPVLLTHGTGHMALANAKAMQLAGIDADSVPPAGGEILRDAAGQPTGVFRENAAAPLQAARAGRQRQRSAEDRRRDLLTAIRLAAEECLLHGVTSFQDAGASFATVDVFRELAEQGELPVRLWVMLSEGNSALSRQLDDYRLIDIGNHHLTVRAIKRLIDGALGTHGAWMLEPYEDLPTSVGQNTTSPDYVRRTAELAFQHKFQLCVHAIGDRANREVLDIFDEATQGQRDRRWRVEHAQHLNPRDIPRFAQLGVIASMQGVHCTSDGPFVVARLGRSRAEHGAYVWRRLLNDNAVVINGTDVPVERISPIECFYASVTRRVSDGSQFFPEQRMSRLEALRSYTRDTAYAAFEEDSKGSLTPGKLADIVVLSHDILTVTETQLLDTKVLYTIVGGRVMYEAEGSRP